MNNRFDRPLIFALLAGFLASVYMAVEAWDPWLSSALLVAALMFLALILAALTGGLRQNGTKFMLIALAALLVALAIHEWRDGGGLADAIEQINIAPGTLPDGDALRTQIRWDPVRDRWIAVPANEYSYILTMGLAGSATSTLATALDGRQTGRSTVTEGPCGYLEDCTWLMSRRSGVPSSSLQFIRSSYFAGQDWFGLWFFTPSYADYIQRTTVTVGFPGACTYTKGRLTKTHGIARLDGVLYDAGNVYISKSELFGTATSTPRVLWAEPDCHDNRPTWHICHRRNEAYTRSYVSRRDSSYCTSQYHDLVEFEGYLPDWFYSSSAYPRLHEFYDRPADCFTASRPTCSWGTERFGPGVTKIRHSGDYTLKAEADWTLNPNARNVSLRMVVAAAPEPAVVID